MSNKHDTGKGWDEELILALGMILEQENQKASIINPKAVIDMQYVYSKLCTLYSGKDNKVTYEYNKPYTSTGSVSIEGKSIIFGDANTFADLTNRASNTDIYPLANGDIRVTFGFHRLTIAVEE